MIEKLLRAIGVFYAFGGVLVLIRLEQARLLDQVHAALSGGERLRHHVRALLLTIGGVLTCVGGVALAGLSARTHWLMGVNTLVQFGWLAFATAWFPPEDAEDHKGRSQTASAAIVYALAFVLVIWTDTSERVALSNSSLMDGMIGLLLAVLVVWQTWLLGRGRLRAARPDAHSDARPDAQRASSSAPCAPPNSFTRPAHVELRPYPGAWPLWDSDSGANVDPSRLELPQDVVTRLQEFENAVLTALDQDPEQGLVFRDARRKRELEQEATALATALEAHLGSNAVAWRMPDELN